MAAAVAESSSSSKGPVAARTSFSFGEWVLSSKEINFPYPVALTLLHMVFSSVVCFAITKVFKFTCSLGYKKCQHILRVWTQSIITVGIEGFHGPGRGEKLGVNPGHWPPSLCSDFIQNSALKDVDFASVHAYPDTWPLPPLPNLEVSDGVEKAADHALVWIKKLLNVFIKE